MQTNQSFTIIPSLPQWVKVFTLDYDLGTPCKVAINIFDEVRKGDNKSMGSAVFDIGELLGARGNTKAKKLKGGGTLFAVVRKAQGSGVLRLGLKGSKLKNVEGMFSKSDPFFELSRKVSSAGGLTWDNVYRSNHIKNSLEPNWDTAVLELSVLCGGDLDLPIRINVFDHESSGKHKNMGQAEMSVKGFQQAASSGQPIKLMNKTKEVGTLMVTKAEVSGVASPSTETVTNRLAATSISQPAPATFNPATAGRPSMSPSGGANFVDYISGGCELNVMVASK